MVYLGSHVYPLGQSLATESNAHSCGKRGQGITIANPTGMHGERGGGKEEKFSKGKRMLNQKGNMKGL